MLKPTKKAQKHSKMMVLKFKVKKNSEKQNLKKVIREVALMFGVVKLMQVYLMASK